MGKHLFAFSLLRIRDPLTVSIICAKAAWEAARIATLLGDPDALAGPMSRAGNGWFLTNMPLSLVARQPFGPGSTTVATLVLDVAAGSGVHHLRLTDGQYVASDGVIRPVTPGTAMKIRVGAQ